MIFSQHGVANIQIFKYFPVKKSVLIIFASCSGYEYIRVFVRIVVLVFLCIIFWHKYIRIFVRIVFDTSIFKKKNLTRPPKKTKVKWLKLLTKKEKYRGKLLSFCCLNYGLTIRCINHKKTKFNIKTKT